MTLLAYAVHKHDPVFITGQAMGLVIYSRNIWFIYGPKPDPAQASQTMKEGRLGDSLARESEA